eukprot:snap_masked-scaffold_8-processed-gene-5.51-mRNA-1 protein AED:1.00 eAED:1.00 QI:0/0/0/0/1/1/4/0/93
MSLVVLKVLGGTGGVTILGGIGGLSVLCVDCRFVLTVLTLESGLMVRFIRTGYTAFWCSEPFALKRISPTCYHFFRFYYGPPVKNWYHSCVNK